MDCDYGLTSAIFELSNFELAFTRVVRSGHKDYKRFYRHLFSSYNLALKENLGDLIKEIKSGTYQPRKPTVIFQPKESTILRPLALLSLCDLIVYQALLNVIATKFEKTQRQYALDRSFGVIYAGKGSSFFFKSWRVCYAAYNAAMTNAFHAGNNYVADFDLVSFYELIDHNLLRCCLDKVVKSRELLDLLFRCLAAWTTDSAGAHIGHGVPQGPEPSAFLAECFLFHFDAKTFKQVKYLRYVDDIKLMAKDEAPLRRALLRLDLASKELGLVPQAQKIRLRKVASLQEIQKTIPSVVASATAMNPTSPQSQKELITMFRRSLRKRGKEWLIDDITKFRFSLLRLNPRRDVLQRIPSMLLKRPDCSWVFAAYLQKFPEDKAAADILLNALRQDPIYDATAANYIEAMDVCEPAIRNPLYQRVIQTANRRSEEKSILLTIASLTFRGRRLGPKDAAKLIGRQKDPVVKGLLLHRLFGNDPGAPYKLTDCAALLEKEVDGDDADLARFCASLLLPDWPWLVAGAWRPPKAAHHSVKLLMLGLGFRARAPRKRGVLDAFFRDKIKIPIPISWRKALGGD
jgi:hypothetical protein